MQTQGASILDQLNCFVQAYHKALEESLDAKGRQHFPFHGESTRVVFTYRAQDGYATFYLTPPPRAVDFPSGYYVRDYPDQTLNEICQASSLCLLKVLPPRLGQSIQTFEMPPNNIDPLPQNAIPWMINEEIAKALVNGTIHNTYGMAISPTVHFINGIRQNIVPQRTHIWSPVVDLPHLGSNRVYQWTYADFWWRPEDLNLDPNRAPEIAETDLLALEAITVELGELSPQLAQRDASQNAADLLDNYCSEFIQLLDKDGHDEETLHQWLNDPRHKLFLDPHVVEVKSKVPFGNKVSDFVLRKQDGTYTLVEIEPATTQLFQKTNHEPTQPFNHACNQIRDWQRYIRENVRTVRDELGLTDIYEPRGMVVIGRSKEIDGADKETKNRWKDIKNKGEFAVFTYDELYESVRALISHLRSLL